MTDAIIGTAVKEFVVLEVVTVVVAVTTLTIVLAVVSTLTDIDGTI